MAIELLRRARLDPANQASGVAVGTVAEKVNSAGMVIPIAGGTGQSRAYPLEKEEWCARTDSNGRPSDS